MKTLSIDIETYSDQPLVKTGVYRYVESPVFEILLFAYSADGAPVQVVDLACGEQIPEEFWPVMRLYLCQNMISSLPWAADFGAEDLRLAIENAARVLEWYDDLREVVPNWYHKR